MVGRKIQKEKQAIRSQPGSGANLQTRNRTKRFGSGGSTHSKLLGATSFLKGSRRRHHTPRYQAGSSCLLCPPPGVRANPAAQSSQPPARSRPAGGTLRRPPPGRRPISDLPPAPLSATLGVLHLRHFPVLFPHSPSAHIPPSFILKIQFGHPHPPTHGMSPFSLLPGRDSLAPVRVSHPPSAFCPSTASPTPVGSQPRMPPFQDGAMCHEISPAHSLDPPSGHYRAAGRRLNGDCVRENQVSTLGRSPSAGGWLEGVMVFGRRGGPSLSEHPC